MPDNAQWLSGNAERNYPFRATTLPELAMIPVDFIIDLRLFLSARQEVEIFLSEIVFVEATDSYTLTFSSATGVELTGTLARLNTGRSRVGQKTVLGEGEKVCLFVPGDKWNTPSWNGAGDWTLTSTADVASLESSVVLPGPKTFRRIIIDGQTDPFAGAYPLDAAQSLVAGYNLEFKMVSPAAITNSGPQVEISAGPGLGSGYAPAEAPELFIRTISGVGPDEQGNVQLVTEDCLRISTPIFEGEPLPNTQEINSDCSVCCSCGKYREMSTRISANSALTKELCDMLSAINDDAQAAFAIGQAYIRDKFDLNVTPLVVARDPQLDGNYLKFTVQNQAPYPVYSYTYVTVAGLPVSGFQVDAPTTGRLLASGLMKETVEADMDNLPPLGAVIGGSTAFPENLGEVGGGRAVRLGYPLRGDGLLYPMPIGGSCAVSLRLSATAIDLAVGTAVKLFTVGRFGAFLNFAELGHQLDSTVDGTLGYKTLKVTT